MNVVNAIEDAALSTGYRREAIVRDYAFADVLDPADPTRQVALAAFTQSPPSYRSAAFAAVSAGEGEESELVRAHRALGAPLLFVVEGERLSLWQVRGEKPLCMHERVRVGDVARLFEENQDKWCPDAIHRAKSIGAVDESYQLDFVDLGLLPVVEGEIHTKLDRLLVETLAASSSVQPDSQLDSKLLFRVVFRLLAAKVLQDRGHPDAQLWNAEDLTSILAGIESYYSLPPVDVREGRDILPAFSAAWNCLRRGISFANISADDLAFVYENTLVTPEARKYFGTHSTPRQLAEYAVTRLGLHRFDPEEISVYEPFAGAGVFLVSALRHMRDLLPVGWNDRKRHDFLIQHLAGDEVDAFACEVAMLSLILADYPNRNGWRIEQADLFEDRRLQSRLQAYNIVLCNPPFQDFSDEERSSYLIGNKAYSKPVEVLNAVLESCPAGFAVVLPRAFILSRKFAAQRKRIEELYCDIEVVELPDRIFRSSSVESALIIAREQRPAGRTVTALCSTEVPDQARIAFLKIGETGERRCTERVIGDSVTGDLWIPRLHPVWDYLQTFPRLGDHFRIHRGIEWQANQGGSWVSQRREGYRKGLHSARHGWQFVLSDPVWLDCRPERLRGRAFQLPWKDRKLVVNAGRLSRGPWRIGAALDKDALLCSQQFFGLWSDQRFSDTELLAFAAILNGPVANAFLATHSPAERIRIHDVKKIPVPSDLPSQLGELVAEYVQILKDSKTLYSLGEQVEPLLMQIDAEVLGAYDLPPRLERQLLAFFGDADRPVAHDWRHWDKALPAPGLTLAERTSGRFHPDGSWFREVFRPLPADEAKSLRIYRT